MIGIPVIDLFAGPGGLGEGFSAFESRGRRRFRSVLAIEKDHHAHQTLTLRKFFHQFEPGEVPVEYYRHLRGQLPLSELFAMFPSEASAARHQAWHCELGVADDREVDARVAAAVAGNDSWVLIGGPPCQAYSLVGRSRMRSSNPAKFESDPRHFLYREYLRIIAKHHPPVFVMENVKGLLSATHGDSNMFDRIASDLSRPGHALGVRGASQLRYRLHALPEADQTRFSQEAIVPQDFVVRAEEYGIPQARHRVIIVGVREGVTARPSRLRRTSVQVSVGDVIGDLPPIRSRLSGQKDSSAMWRTVLTECATALTASHRPLSAYLAKVIREAPELTAGAEFVNAAVKPTRLRSWLSDSRLRGVCNHASRSHIAADIQRYFFAAGFAALGGDVPRSPQLAEFPAFLPPLAQ